MRKILKEKKNKSLVVVSNKARGKRKKYINFTISKQLNFISLKNESERKLKIYCKKEKRKEICNISFSS